VKVVFPNIKSNGILHVLRLDRNNLGGTEFITSCNELIGQYSRLSHISMDDCNLGDKGGEAIFKALLPNRTIKSISFEKNLFGVLIFTLYIIG
jgi:Ran GTPase-activating protein (RanGAP) involved in mRNA processing and transport